MNQQLSVKDWELLSAYLDQQLSEPQARDLEKRLESSTNLKNCLNELQITRSVLRQTPHRRVPRNFTLTPAMIKPRPAERFFPVFSFASAFAIILLAISYLLEALPAAPAARIVAEQAAPAAATHLATPPPIILWEGKTAPANVPEMMEGLGVGGGEGGAQPPQASAALPAEKESQEYPEVKIPAPAQPEQLPSGEIQAAVPAVPAVSPLPTQAVQADTLVVPEEKTLAERPPIEEKPAEIQPTQAEPLPTTTLAIQREEPGSGPILGIRPTQDAGKIISTSAAISPQPITESFSPFPTIRMGLAVFAIGAGLVAFLIRRRTY